MNKRKTTDRPRCVRRQTARAFVTFSVLALASISSWGQTLTLQSITVSPNPAIAGPGIPVQMHAIGTFSDGSMRDITTGVQWSATSGLNINPVTGLLSNQGGGIITSGTITATLGAVSGKAAATEAPDVDNQPVTATIGVGQQPVALAVNPVTNKIYVANQTENTVTAIDGATNTTTTIPVGTAPLAIAVNSVTNKIYVANSGSPTLTVIDGATRNTATITTSGAGNQTVVVNPATNQVFVSGPATGIVQIDGATNHITQLSSIFALGMGVNTQTNTLYATNFVGIIYVINLASGSTVATISIGEGFFTTVLVNPAINQVYFGVADGSRLAVLNGATNQIVAKLPGGQLALNPVSNQVIQAVTGIQLYNAAANTESPLFVGQTTWDTAAINPVTNQVYLASRSGNTLAILDGRSGYVTALGINPNNVHEMASTVSTGGAPSAIAVNPATNLIYVANSGTNNVTVVSGASNSFTFFRAVGQSVPAADVNPFTGTGYVADGGNSVIAINGATGATTSIPTGQTTDSVLVNPLTNMIYALNEGSNSITAINGATLSVTNVSTGKSPLAGAINPLTNTVYAGNSDGSLTVFNGNTNGVTNLNVGAPSTSPNPAQMAINVATNQLYIADFNNSAVEVVNGYTNAVSSYPVGAGPIAVALNPTTNLAYVANRSGNSVSVLNAATGATSTIQLPFAPFAIGVNAFTNIIYAAGPEGSLLSVAAINGSTNQVTTTTYPITFGVFDGVMTVDSVTDRIYIADVDSQTVAIDGETGALLTPSDTATGLQLSAVDLALDPVHDLLYAQTGGDVAVVTEEPTQTSPLSMSIGTLPGNLTTNPLPSFTLSAVDGLDPNSPPVENVYYRFDTLAGPWAAETPNGNATFTVTPSAPLTPGFHVLLAWAANGGENSLSGSYEFVGASPLISPIARYGFYVAPYQSILIQASSPTLVVGGAEQLTATATLNDGTQMDVTNLATWSSSASQVASVSASGIVAAVSQGSSSITASYAGASGSTSLTVAPAIYQLHVIPSVSLGGNGNYVVQLAVSNQGDTVLNNVTLNLAELNSTTVTPPAPVPTLAAGASANLQVVFPASAGAPNSRALLKVGGSYTGIVPGGAPQNGSFSDNYRITLP